VSLPNQRHLRWRRHLYAQRTCGDMRALLPQPQYVSRMVLRSVVQSLCGGRTRIALSRIHSSTCLQRNAESAAALGAARIACPPDSITIIKLTISIHLHGRVQDGAATSQQCEANVKQCEAPDTDERSKSVGVGPLGHQCAPWDTPHLLSHPEIMGRRVHHRGHRAALPQSPLTRSGCCGPPRQSC